MTTEEIKVRMLLDRSVLLKTSPDQLIVNLSGLGTVSQDLERAAQSSKGEILREILEKEGLGLFLS